MLEENRSLQIMLSETLTKVLKKGSF